MDRMRDRRTEPLERRLDALLAEAEDLGVFIEPYRERIEVLRRRLVEEIEDAKVRGVPGAAVAL